jgi:NAD(P)-dependent dehydrogenase (short-subunit alcohol dehydrogenase family)
VALDVAEPDQVAPAFDAAEAAFGTVTLLVNNAGISGGKRALEMSPRGLAQRAQDQSRRGLVRRPGGGAAHGGGGQARHIINVASLLGFRVAPTLSAYAVAKAGVVQLTAALAVELARHRIRVNAIAPGYILTEINREFFSSPKGEALIKTIPQRRIGEPGDLDGTLLLLASSRAAGFMTGSTIVVDGGQMHAMG